MNSLWHHNHLFVRLRRYHPRTVTYIVVFGVVWTIYLLGFR